MDEKTRREDERIEDERTREEEIKIRRTEIIRMHKLGPQGREGGREGVALHSFGFVSFREAMRPNARCLRLKGERGSKAQEALTCVGNADIVMRIRPRRVVFLWRVGPLPISSDERGRSTERAEGRVWATRSLLACLGISPSPPPPTHTHYTAHSSPAPRPIIPPPIPPPHILPPPLPPTLLLSRSLSSCPPPPSPSPSADPPTSHANHPPPSSSPSPSSDAESPRALPLPLPFPLAALLLPFAFDLDLLFEDRYPEDDPAGLDDAQLSGNSAKLIRLLLAGVDAPLFRAPVPVLLPSADALFESPILPPNAAAHGLPPPHDAGLVHVGVSGRGRPSGGRRERAVVPVPSASLLVPSPLSAPFASTPFTPLAPAFASPPFDVDTIAPAAALLASTAARAPFIIPTTGTPTLTLCLPPLENRRETLAVAVLAEACAAGGGV
ncbi:hypothetical protein C8R43DRAFT_1137275 [Mycena crocata]|nr:hypothetical protein C8R43DRAFT_1137275 [Mycena crocata]